MANGEWHAPGPTDLLFPKWPRELFNAILEEEKLRTDRGGRPRTAYSLRHTYICLCLLEGADIYQIAKNCRTSVEMIEKYYAAHLKTPLDASAINIMRAPRCINARSVDDGRAGRHQSLRLTRDESLMTHASRKGFRVNPAGGTPGRDCAAHLASNLLQPESLRQVPQQT